MFSRNVLIAFMIIIALGGSYLSLIYDNVDDVKRIRKPVKRGQYLQSI